MVVEVGAAEPPEVEGHAIHWMKVGARSSWESYKSECEAIGPGFRMGKDVFAGTWGNWIPFTQQAVYTCFSP
jgi:hypothetical protein